MQNRTPLYFLVPTDEFFNSYFMVQDLIMFLKAGSILSYQEIPEHELSCAPF